MLEADTVIIGNGPAGLAIANKYIQTAGNGKVILLDERSQPPGAYSKGVKSVNSIVPKLPRITDQAAEMYNYITQRVLDSEAALARVYRTIHPYQGDSKIGFRYCKNVQEHEILCGVTAIRKQDDRSFNKIVAKFVNDSLGHSMDGSKLFAFPEKIWNIRGYLEIMATRIPPGFIQHVERVQFLEEKNGIVLLVEYRDGNVSKLRTQKLLVCKGLGNINFEEGVRAVKSAPTKSFGFEVLDLTKFLYKSAIGIPGSISSIMVPNYKVCLTNEAVNMHSILYNTNASLIPADKYNPANEASVIDEINQELLKTNPAVPQKHHEAFRCAMTLKLQAYIDQPDLHFNFIKSTSVVDHIHYLNLPYFTVIQVALQSLPEKIIDIK